MKKIISLFSLLFLLSVPVRAEKAAEPVVLDLKTTLTLVSQQNPSVLLARARVQLVLARVNEQKAILYPQVKVDALGRRQTHDLRSNGMSSIGPSASPLIGPFGSVDARLKVTQKLFDPALKRRLDWARLGEKTSQVESRKITDDLLALAATQYIQAVRARQRLVVFRSALSRDYKILKMTRMRHIMGLATDLDLVRRRMRCVESLQAARAARREDMESRFDLMSVLGLSFDRKIILESWEEGDKLYAASPAPAANSDVLLAEAKVVQARQLVASEKAEYWPKLSADADYGVGGEGFASGDSSETYGFGIQASLPVFDGESRKNRIEASEIELKASEIQLEDVKLRNQNDVVLNRQMLRDAGSSIARSRQQIVLAKDQLRLARREFEVGSGDEVAIWIARTEMVNAIDQKLEAEAVYLMSAVNLAHATGTLDQWIEK